MKYGHLQDISEIDFSIPDDHPLTAKVLKKRKAPPMIYAGLPVWGDDGFSGKVYPVGTKPKNFLRLYAERFNAIELNATGYRIPPVSFVESWVKVVPKGFKFCPKVSMPISAVKPLGKNMSAVNGFFDAMHAFGDNLGPIFLQLHPNFGPPRLDDLLHFLDIWDAALPLHVELRHPAWFMDQESLDTLFAEMRKKKIGTVITDTAGRRDAVHQCLTTSTAFIRFDGNEGHPSDFVRIAAWAARIKQWIDQGLQTVYFFTHTHTKSLTPELSNHFLAEMNALCGLELKLVEIL